MLHSFCFIPGDGRRSGNNGTIRNPPTLTIRPPGSGNAHLFLTHSHHPSPPESPSFPAVTTRTKQSGRLTQLRCSRR